MKKLNTTSHSIRRGNQRLGLSKNETYTQGDRARQFGLTEKQVKGKLLDAMRTTHGNTRYYNNAIYIFDSSSNRLITVIRVDPSFETNLVYYVDFPTLVNYKKHKYQYMSNRAELNRDLFDARKKMVRILNNTYFKNTTVKAEYIEITNDDIIIHVDTRDIEKIKYWQDGFRRLYNMSLDIRQPIEKMVKNWFYYYQGLNVNVTYEDTLTVVIESNKDIYSGVKHFFKEEFNRELLVEKKEKTFETKLTEDMTESIDDFSAKVIDWFNNYGIKVIILDIDSFMVSVMPSKDIPNKLVTAFNEEFGKMLETR